MTPRVSELGKETKMATTKQDRSFTGRKAMVKNFAEDGIRIRSVAFKNSAKYDRKNKSWKEVIEFHGDMDSESLFTWKNESDQEDW